MDTDSHFSLGRQVIQLEIDQLQAMHERLDPTTFDAVVTALVECIQRRSKVVVLGVGKSGNIGHKIAATLNSTGAPTVVLNSQNALHGDLGIVSPQDIVIALSQSGETPELLELLPHVKRMETFIIGMTGNPDSTLAEMSDLVLDTVVDREACPLGLAPTSSTTVMLVLGDAIAMALLHARGFTNEDFARFHPGGSLGKALSRVSDIMRSEHLPLAGPHETVQRALEVMNKARAGACIIVDNEGRLAGIFTHGDFARSFQQNAAIGSVALETLMTKCPVTIPASSFAVEALKTIGENRIDDVVVLDEDKKPVGLIDTQDLARLRAI